jgi:hypothetical protein
MSNLILDTAYRDFLDWAIRQEDMRTNFAEATGYTLSTGSPIHDLIDEKTGYLEEAMKRFVVWVTENHWGKDRDLLPEGYYDLKKSLEKSND